MAKYSDPTIPAPSDGVIRGDDRSYPNQGTSSGLKQTYGADVSLMAKNRLGSAHVAPDPMDECCPPGPGDFRAAASHHSAGGRSIRGATGSDPAGDTTPGDEGMPGDRD